MPREVVEIPCIQVRKVVPSRLPAGVKPFQEELDLDELVADRDDPRDILSLRWFQGEQRVKERFAEARNLGGKEAKFKITAS
ncbi:hypothetical protein [Streptomyces nigrescens]|uniref:hypothetical protein n=1 Tax=Streptomyces nigrescens TaxID=1920 RepID=UPI0021C2DB98|nr:hypothetical protein [Streptomyces nigrescens]